MKLVLSLLIALLGSAAVGNAGFTQTNLPSAPTLLAPRSPGVSTNLFEPQHLRRGIYKTEPYSMIVVAPGSQLDDRAMIGARRSETNLLFVPTIRPELRFIPRRAR